MAGTRTSPRQAAKANSSPHSKSSGEGVAGAKRKADSAAGSSPTTKKGRKEDKLEQKTLEETMPVNDEGDDAQAAEAAENNSKSNGTSTHGTTESASASKNGHADHADHADDADFAAMKQAEEDEDAGSSETGTDEKTPSQGKEEDNKTVAPASEESGAIKIDKQKELPSSILEKGIIYFLTRGRVGIEDPKSVSDLQRSFFVLRPLPAGATLDEGVVQDLGNNRLFALPKKVLPKSHQDRFMVFVEKGKTTIKDLKEDFFQGSEYETQTAGIRSNPPVSLVGEGVYALTTESRNTHLAYMTTIPSELGDIQQDMGIRSKGSFLISLKNPTVSGPANASLPQAPDFPKAVIDEFRGRAWMPPSDPKQLDYPNAQFLLIGEGEKGFDNALKRSADGNQEDPAAKQEIEELENQDEIRVEHLHGDHTIFDDLNISKKEYSLATTW